MTNKQIKKKLSIYLDKHDFDIPSLEDMVDFAQEVADEATEELKEENEQLKKQVNTYLEMLADKTKKRIPDSKGYTIWDKSLTETIRELQEEKDKLWQCLGSIVYMAESGLHTKNEIAFVRIVSEAKDLLLKEKEG